MIAYAGDAYSLSPLTTDASTLAGIIENLSPELMPFQGSNLPAAIELALSQFSQADANQGDIVVLADDLDDSELARSLNLVKGKTYESRFLQSARQTAHRLPYPTARFLRPRKARPLLPNTPEKPTNASQQDGRYVCSYSAQQPRRG